MGEVCRDGPMEDVLIPPTKGTEDLQYGGSSGNGLICQYGERASLTRQNLG